MLLSQVLKLPESSGAQALGPISTSYVQIKPMPQVRSANASRPLHFVQLWSTHQRKHPANILKCILSWQFSLGQVYLVLRPSHYTSNLHATDTFNSLL